MDGRAGQHRALMGPARGQLRTLNPSSFCLPLHLHPHLSTPSPPPLAFHCHFSCFLGVGWGPDIFVKSRVLRVYLSVQCFEHVQSLRRCIPMQSCILCYIYTSTHVCMLIHMHAFCAFHIHPTPFSQDTCFQVCVLIFLFCGIRQFQRLCSSLHLLVGNVMRCVSHVIQLVLWII